MRCQRNWELVAFIYFVQNFQKLKNMVLALRYRAMLRRWDFYIFWHLASYTGNLPILGNLSGVGLPSFSNVWQVAKISWHAAKGTPPDPPWSWIVPNIASATKSAQKRHIFMDFRPRPLTFDRDFPKISKRPSGHILIPKFRSVGPSAAAGEVETYVRKES